uniref:Uncharacterized protein n=1 Tax=Oryza sativa subsp. japonica TaxID=39947 RepID=Q6ZIA5_ORYSJ|nr:hypothetical protein [Oryza sativa Japonica Group]BAD09115.1 hypothetical protein [Oryza sativa Japonica Group]
MNEQIEERERASEAGAGRAGGRAGAGAGAGVRTAGGGVAAWRPASEEGCTAGGSLWLYRREGGRREAAAMDM